MIDTVVIGGGQAGLAASWHLTRRGIEHVVLERGRVAESWQSQRWDSFTLNTPNWMNRLPGESDDADPAPRASFLARVSHVDHLRSFADRHALPIRTGVTVTGLTPTQMTSSGVATAGGGSSSREVREGREGRFVVATRSDRGGDEIEARSIVVASGPQRVPKIPPLAAQFPAWIHQLHVSEYRRPADLPTGSVLVVGSGQSGVQVVEDLLGAGRRVDLCTSAVPRLRRRYRGRDSLEWLVPAGFFDMTLDRLPDPRMRSMAQPVISGVGRFGHTVSLQYLAEQGATLLGRPSGIRGNRLFVTDSVGGNIAFGDRTSAEFRAGMDESIRAAGVSLPAVEADPADEPHPDPAGVHSRPFLDLDEAGIATVIWATGFTGDLGYLPGWLLDDHGAPIHEHGVSPVRGMYYLGFPWLSSRKSAIIYGIGEDAAFVSDRVASGLAGVGGRV
jgi:putative flavoprotein involved in K+ transport